MRVLLVTLCGAKQVVDADPVDECVRMPLLYPMPMGESGCFSQALAQPSRPPLMRAFFRWHGYDADDFPAYLEGP